MCGIAGIISSNPSEISVDRLKKMTDIIAHRGPDGDGQWISSNGKVGLGHRRLSIIDLSHNADQPMHYMDRYSIVFNGEIYNYIELKDILIKEGYLFKTQSDTEVLMALYHKEGEKCLQLLDGMFSFAIYDEKEQTVFCARDRFGEKPFFYAYEQGKYFIFGSELKTLWAAGIPKEINNTMLCRFLLKGEQENATDLSETFYNNCKRLPHSRFINMSLSSLSITIKPYYDIQWQNVNSNIKEKDATEQFRSLFYESVKRRLRSDVPVGSSLSGGLDSSLVVGTIDNLLKGTSQIQKTFSAVFPGFAKDESRYMQMVINQTNVKPYFVTPDDESMIRNLDKLFFHQEEPFISASIYVQYCVMQLAKENDVTVLLDGQGADEILAGYHSYYQAHFASLKRENQEMYKEAFGHYQRLHADNNINTVIQNGLKQNIIGGLRKNFPKTLEIVKAFRSAGSQSTLSKDFINTFNKKERSHIPQSLNEALYESTFHVGMQNLLRYADRNSMAHSREVRLPFLSHELVEFIFSLPPSFKIREGWTKWIMRCSFAKELPEAIAWRKDKIGYEPPQKSWMDRKIMQEKIRFAQEKLVSENILKPSVLNSAPMNGSDNASWSHLIASQMFE
jgi:asparagine synthase (glutamine-hydrolysing)